MFNTLKYIQRDMLRSGFFSYCNRIARDERFQRLPCMHKGTYADDCLVNRVSQVFLGVVVTNLVTIIYFGRL